MGSVIPAAEVSKAATPTAGLAPPALPLLPPRPRGRAPRPGAGRLTVVLTASRTSGPNPLPPDPEFSRSLNSPSQPPPPRAWGAEPPGWWEERPTAGRGCARRRARRPARERPLHPLPRPRHRWKGGKGIIVAPALESCRGASSHRRWETGQTRVWLDFQASQVPCSAAPLPPGGPAWHVWLAFCVPRAGFQSPVSGGGTAARPPGLGTVSSVLGWERDGQMDAGAGYKTLPILHHTQLPPDSCAQGPQSPPVARQSSCPSPTGAGGREGLDSGLLPALAKDAT